MQNKRWKREAKKTMGRCINNKKGLNKKHCWHCESQINCMQLFAIPCYDLTIRQLEQRYRVKPKSKKKIRIVKLAYCILHCVGKGWSGYGVYPNRKTKKYKMAK